MGRHKKDDLPNGEERINQDYVNERLTNNCL
jgi:hypothetical protein